MQAAEPWKCHDPSHDGRLDGPMLGGIFGQGQVAAILVVPGRELGKQATGMPFVQYNDVIEALSTQSADHPLAMSVHQRCLNGRLDLADAQALCSPREFESVGSIAIPDQKLRSCLRAASGTWGWRGGVVTGFTSCIPSDADPRPNRRSAENRVCFT